MPLELHIAQVNIARMRVPLDDPLMADFVVLLDEINALADRSPGFVWRLQSAEGDATYFRPYDDDRILFNLSVWRSIDELKEYVYRSAHGEVMRRRREWFERMEEAYMAMWWVEAGHIPSIAEARDRLEYLRTHGPSAHAFTFRSVFEPSEDAIARVAGEVAGEPCGAA